MKDLPKTVVAIPCYNCEKQLPRVLDGFDAALLKRVSKVVIIDNRSTDGTLDTAVKAARRFPGKKVEVWKNDDNYGLGGTHKVALLRAEREGADYLAILHGDHQAQTEELHQLLDEAEKHPKVAAVLGARFLPTSRLQGYSKVRTLGNRGLNLAYTLITTKPTSDLGSGINLFRLRDLKDRSYLRFSDGFTFNIDLLLHYYRRKNRLRFLPISWSETDQVSNARAFRIGKIALETLLRWRVGMEKRKNAGPADYPSTQIA